MKLTDQDELDLQCLCSDKRPCEWRTAMQTMRWIVDLKCPIRKVVREEVAKYFRDKEHEKNEREHPDEAAH